MNETKQNYLDKIYHMLETMLESFVFVDTSKNMTPIYFINDVNNWVEFFHGGQPFLKNRKCAASLVVTFGNGLKN